MNEKERKFRKVMMKYIESDSLLQILLTDLLICREFPLFITIYSSKRGLGLSKEFLLLAYLD